jgi:hypothetical protein
MLTTPVIDFYRNPCAKFTKTLYTSDKLLPANRFGISTKSLPARGCCGKTPQPVPKRCIDAA